MTRKVDRDGFRNFVTGKDNPRHCLKFGTNRDLPVNPMLSDEEANYLLGLLEPVVGSVEDGTFGRNGGECQMGDMLEALRAVLGRELSSAMLLDIRNGRVENTVTIQNALGFSENATYHKVLCAVKEFVGDRFSTVLERLYPPQYNELPLRSYYITPHIVRLFGSPKGTESLNEDIGAFYCGREFSEEIMTAIDAVIGIVVRLCLSRRVDEAERFRKILALLKYAVPATIIRNEVVCFRLSRD